MIFFLTLPFLVLAIFSPGLAYYGCMALLGSLIVIFGTIYLFALLCTAVWYLIFGATRGLSFAEYQKQRRQRGMAPEYLEFCRVLAARRDAQSVDQTNRVPPLRRRQAN